MNKLLVYLGIAVCLLWTGGDTVAQRKRPSREYEFKASYLYHFCRLTTWPPPPKTENGSPPDLVIGILGRNPFVYRRAGKSRDYLKDITNVQKINKRRMVVENFDEADDMDCDLLFIRKGPGAKQRLRTALRKIGSRPVLIVTESPGFADQGAMINFQIPRNKIKLELNSANARRANLKFSDKLLNLNNAKDVAPSGNPKKSPSAGGSD